MPPLELTPAALAEIIGRGELEVLGRMPYSSNATFLAQATLDGAEVTVVYKPRRGERPLWDFPTGTLCAREVAAYEVSEALGWALVPVTALRDGPAGIGSVQRFVDHDPDEHFFTLLEAHEARFRRFAIFDALINNTDRKSGHCLFDRIEESIVGIDHGLTFHEDWKLRTVIWDFAGEAVAEADVEGLAGVLEDLTTGGPLRASLAVLLCPEELEAVVRRGRDLLEGGLPLPDDGYRSVPWPLV